MTKKYSLKYYLCFLNLINFSIFKTVQLAVKRLKNTQLMKYTYFNTLIIIFTVFFIGGVIICIISLL